jgi:chromosome segregation ATPase
MSAQEKIYELEARLEAFEWKMDHLLDDIRHVREELIGISNQLAKLDERIPPKPKTALTATIASGITTAILLVIDYLQKLGRG